MNPTPAPEDRCPHCSFDPTSMSDYCEKHRPKLKAPVSPIQPAVGGMTQALPEFDRDDSDGELLMDWSPRKGRMVSLSLRADGRLSYAILWDDEKVHGTAQMPATEDDALTVAYMKGFSDGKAATRQTGGVDQAWVDMANRLAGEWAGEAFTFYGSDDPNRSKNLRAARESLRTHLSTALGAKGKS